MESNRRLNALAIISVMAILVSAGIIQSVQAKDGYIMNLILGAMHDVVLDNPTSGEVLTYNGTYWINGNAPTDDYELLCQNTLTVSATSISCANFPIRNHVFFETNIINSNIGIASTYGLVLNGDTGNNYAERGSVNGGADFSTTGVPVCRPVNGATIPLSSIVLVTGHIYNSNSANNKMIEGQYTNAPITAPQPVGVVKGEFRCLWSNTTNQVTSITWTRVTGNNTLSSGSNISVWGYN